MESQALNKTKGGPGAPSSALLEAGSSPGPGGLGSSEPHHQFGMQVLPNRKAQGPTSQRVQEGWPLGLWPFRAQVGPWPGTAEEEEDWDEGSACQWPWVSCSIPLHCAGCSLSSGAQLHNSSPLWWSQSPSESPSRAGTIWNCLCTSFFFALGALICDKGVIIPAVLPQAAGLCFFPQG